MQFAQKWIDDLVRVVNPRAGGLWTVQLFELLAEPVTICAHENPAVVEKEAEKVRAYVSADSRSGAEAFQASSVFAERDSSLT